MSKDFPEISALLVQYNEAKTKMWKVYLSRTPTFPSFFKAMMIYEYRYLDLGFSLVNTVRNTPLTRHEHDAYMEIGRRLCDENDVVTSFVQNYIKKFNYKPKNAKEDRWYQVMLLRCHKLSREPDMTVKEFFNNNRIKKEIFLKSPFSVESHCDLFHFSSDAIIKVFE